LQFFGYLIDLKSIQSAEKYGKVAVKVKKIKRKKQVINKTYSEHKIKLLIYTYVSDILNL